MDIHVLWISVFNYPWFYVYPFVYPYGFQLISIHWLAMDSQSRVCERFEPGFHMRAKLPKIIVTYSCMLFSWTRRSWNFDLKPALLILYDYFKNNVKVSRKKTNQRRASYPKKYFSRPCSDVVCNFNNYTTFFFKNSKWRPLIVAIRGPETTLSILFIERYSLFSPERRPDTYTHTNGLARNFKTFLRGGRLKKNLRGCITLLIIVIA